MITIKNLENTDTETIVRAFMKVFADYSVRFSEEQIKALLKRRGYTPELSFAAFDGAEIAAFTLNGTGQHNGLPTVYDTGTGTLKEYRGQGLASEILKTALPHLQETGIRQYLLEALTNNAKAVSLYEKAGFRKVREFDCYVQNRCEISDRQTAPACKADITPIATNSLTADFHDFVPSWQNSFDSIERAGNALTILGAFLPDGELAGYIVYEPDSGDITQIAVKREHRRNGIGTLLLDKAFESIRTETVKILNVETNCTTMKTFLAGRNIFVTSRQFEMIMDIKH